MDVRPTLHNLLLRYTMALLNQIAQSTSCNRLHAAGAILRAELLQTRDRVNGEAFR